MSALDNILTQYLTGASVPLLVSGSSISTGIAPIQDGLSHLSLSTTMNGITDKLITNLAISASVEDLYNPTAQAVATLYNPLDVDFTITRIQANTTHYVYCNYTSITTDIQVPEPRPDIFHTEYLVGTVDYELDTPLTVKAKSSATSEPWPVSLNFGLALEDGTALPRAMIVAMADHVFFLNVTQSATVVIGNNYPEGYQVDDFYYTQDDVPYSIDVPGVSDQPLSLFITFCPNMENITLFPDDSVSALTMNSTNATTTTTAVETTSVSLTFISVETSTTTTLEAVTTTETTDSTTITTITTAGQTTTTDDASSTTIV